MRVVGWFQSRCCCPEAGNREGFASVSQSSSGQQLEFCSAAKSMVDRILPWHHGGRSWRQVGLNPDQGNAGSGL